MYISPPFHIYTSEHEEVKNMAKWKAVRVKQELVEQVQKEVEKDEYKNLSEFVSEAIQFQQIKLHLKPK